MAAKPLTIAEKRHTLFVYRENGNNGAAAARELDIPRSTLQHRLESLKVEGFTDDGSVDVLHPPAEIDIDELVSRRKTQYGRKDAHEVGVSKITSKVRLPGPVGILFFGDPHVDDDGCDIELLEEHCRLTKETEGLWGANIGDTTNNWVGRLAGLYAEQSTSAKEAVALAEWFIGSADWLFIISGNHDAWAGANDPIRWMARQSNTLRQTAAVRMELVFPKGEPLVINARHNFKGHSMWNEAHGVGKAAMLGPEDEIFVNGHTHVSGYCLKKRPSGIVSHCIQLASYKVHDRYAKELGLPDARVSSAVLTIIKPEADRLTDRVQVFHDVQAGVDYLNFLRKDL